ncbi:hypothetical protein DL762_006414 [Monosporascus cannonballus]|uniref:Prion-inhibition and propagation HeLo domain-containing protein n=1 Tax=Monosporascus cannonballus TaxID=155416 RepID=A0ABY0H6G3_9PEZI|nr:hypothetical protein DL762_006414 [Monosporascus cannonballus]RYO86479.1 hypothetical protein DL763_006671 [Monosporascus cannonballus]
MTRRFQISRKIPLFHDIDLATIRGRPSAQHAIQLACHQLAQAPPINLDSYRKDAWHVLNSSDYTELSDSKQYDAARDACPLKTKQNALETIRKILKMMLLTCDTLGREVRKDLQWDADIPNVMIRILESMYAEDRIRVGSAADAKGSLAEKIQWILDEAVTYGLKELDSLDRVFELMGEDVHETGEGE